MSQTVILTATGRFRAGYQAARITVCDKTHAKAKAVRLVVLTAAMRLTWIILNDTAHIPDAAAIRNVWHHNQKIRERGRVSQLETSEADYLEAFAGE